MQRDSVPIACQLNIPSYNRLKKLDDLKEWLGQIELWKDSLSYQIGWYLKHRQKFDCELDINRKCRALGIPPHITGIIAASPFLKEHWQRIKTELKYDKGNKIIKHDIEELGVYMRMYQEIELVKDTLKDRFPFGNPFEYLMKLMGTGAVIIRFKYVKDGNKKPQEKIVSYHTYGNTGLLFAHVEGDSDFSMHKRWGEGDEKLIPMYSEYQHRQIRWGIDDFGKKGKFTY